MFDTNISDDVLRSKFTGALLGTMVGDSIGAPVEGWEADHLNKMLDGISLLTHAERELNYAVFGMITGGSPAPGSGYYTDDTQMTICVAETLTEHGGKFDGPDLAARFADDFDVHRGYGLGAYTVLTRLRAGQAWDYAAHGLFGGQGSYGNGAAMRVAPVGLFFHDRSQFDQLRSFAEAQASITHQHLLGQEGAVLQAAAVAAATRASTEDDFDPYRFIDDLKQLLREDAGDYLTSCDAILSMLFDRPDPVEVAEVLGNGLEAYLSVPSAIYSFLAHHDSFAEAVLFAIRLGGDTDTIGAMCGAIAGAFHGVDAIPHNWLAMLENRHKGRDYMRRLGGRLFETWANVREPATGIA